MVASGSENENGMSRNESEESKVQTYFFANDDSTAPALSVQVSKRTLDEWFKKYFLEGQKLDGLAEAQAMAIPPDASFDQKLFVKYRKFIAILIPFTVAQVIWWCTALKMDYLSLYPTHWEMPLTMIFGAIVAGMTSEGGGAVAFPVMTFVLHLGPETARDFSIMIQSVGMSMALFVIVFMRIQIEWRAIIFGTAGAIPGALIGFHLIDSLWSAAVKKMAFVSIWTAFAVSLWILNREKKRPTVLVIQNFNWWKALTLVLTGFIGGIFTSFAGSGVDICIFSCITLLFSVSEKTATPTTIVLMALNSQFCFYWRGVIMGDISQLAFDYLKVCVPVATTFAPLGSFLGSHFHRQTLAFFIYILETVAFVGFLCTLPPWQLVVSSVTIIALGFAFFSFLSRAGKRLIASDTGTPLTFDENEIKPKIIV
ncbi:sulfite exporter tauE/SafE domain-containing protein [Ditylenchus destructor]|uniref:Sulfite exporter tauE/SafE domain-containing protein n=1 Tax=Ditylenchus destructor TaxID=166010 RepID=A0AAD4N6B3_9BILA|nr:sulfite exporter tauE/SafE domain-containing protein [Ditylenchus destructor]